MSTPRTIVILTGAGVSAESGLPTFRDANGLWEGHRFEDVATPEAFARDPHLAHRFYNLRRAALRTVEPNAAHGAIAKLQREYPGEVVLVTQNVDDLHERAGSPSAIHMHGELTRVRCEHCDSIATHVGDLSIETRCGGCEKPGGMRPHIVWFGEIPFAMESICQAVARADVFVAIGTSGVVYPAAGFVLLAKEAGAETIEINNAATEVSPSFARRLTGLATEQVSTWVASMLQSTPTRS